jgi:hypothetical protein
MKQINHDTLTTSRKNRNAASDQSFTPASPSHEELERRAYLKYVNSGYAAGNDLAHWLEAEKELSESHQTMAKIA